MTKDNKAIIFVSHHMVLKALGPASFMQLTKRDTLQFYKLQTIDKLNAENTHWAIA